MWLSLKCGSKEIPAFCGHCVCHSNALLHPCFVCQTITLSGKRSTLQLLHQILESSTRCSVQRCHAQTATDAQPSSAPYDGRSTMWVSYMANISSFAMSVSPTSRSILVTPGRLCGSPSPPLILMPLPLRALESDRTLCRDNALLQSYRAPTT